MRGVGGGTAGYREFYLNYLKGDGLDLGFGGASIQPTAITIDLDTPYQTHRNKSTQHLSGDARELHWFKDEVFDYVYSSHLLEDFIDTRAVIEEWLRVIKPGGVLALLLPDQQRFLKEAQRIGAGNANHKHSKFSFSKIKSIMRELNVTIIKEYEFYKMKDFNKDREYNFGIIVRKNNEN